MTSFDVLPLCPIAVPLVGIFFGICACAFYLRRIAFEQRAIRKTLQARWDYDSFIFRWRNIQNMTEYGENILITAERAFLAANGGSLCKSESLFVQHHEQRAQDQMP